MDKPSCPLVVFGIAGLAVAFMATTILLVWWGF
ncbi:hypothetical protein ABIE49_002555 [Bradyrhizobium sp. OAE829]